MTSRNGALLALIATVLAAPVAAQDIPGGGTAQTDTTPAQTTETAAAALSVSVGSPAAGAIRQFEPARMTRPFAGINMQIGGAFAQTWQSLDHETEATPAGNTMLGAIRPGFVLANANLNIGVQLTRGIRVDLESYMASRHHNEFWVKGGYATIEESPIDMPVLNRIMEYTTIRAGHMELNYGDAHFRRTDNGNALRNPFVENYILDSFTTEIGAEILVRSPSGLFVMGGVTSGQNKGDIKDGAVDASPAFLGKLGFDRQLSDALRVRLSGSLYSVDSSPSVTLFGGDRTGSHYWGVMEDTTSLKAGTAFTNGRINPGFSNEMTAYQINPYVEFGGLELFGVIEHASGKSASAAARRDVDHLALDAIYRFANDRFYAGARYNRLNGDWSNQTDLTVTRNVLAAGWFITPNLLTKVEYVNQSYDGFAATDIRHGAKFNGLVIEGVIGF